MRNKRILWAPSKQSNICQWSGDGMVCDIRSQSQWVALHLSQEADWMFALSLYSPFPSNPILNLSIWDLSGNFVVCLSSWDIQLSWLSPDSHQFLNPVRYDLPFICISEISSISGTRIFQLSISIGNLGYNLSAASKDLKNFYTTIPYFQSI